MAQRWVKSIAIRQELRKEERLQRHEKPFEELF
jgi:hypothetical protein